MGYWTDIMVGHSHAERDAAKRYRAVEEAMAAAGMALHGGLKQISLDGMGRLAASEYRDDPDSPTPYDDENRAAVLRAVAGAGWERPESVQVFIQTENCKTWHVYKIDGIPPG
ncbi:MAG: hypothetical protein V4671_20740 [Armatimonadota bacterium]